ncbi:hypothetical protein SAMN05192534_11848 [Alteribacillus persepolensis]|uniref:Uncharacterized protein n=1 Tax=Alteribacillus persepolensis TaxID=568899 RepID=A0A1G8H474_9BACI|nr:hypothetical protein [Alteribacillus persepolensis]SDI01445.1 hypothetical protein SAMN05192534_11848 [Alteribacillus persepolensis]
MRKRNILLSSAVAGVVGTATFLLRDEEKRDRLKQASQRTIAKWTGTTKEDEDERLNEKVGHSEPYDIDDNNMVAEGAMHSVHHYNKAQEEGEEPLRTSMEESK